MNNLKHFAIGSFAAVIILLSVPPVTAQSPVSVRQSATEINAANTLLRDGKVDEALDVYRTIVPVEQQRDELSYNIAVAEYRKGNIDAAEKLFTDVVGTDSLTIAADSRYNLGNCQYAGALKVAEQDKPAAIELLRKAIANYRGALRGKPNNPDARANIELAGELIRRLEQEQKNEDQQQKEDQQRKQDDQQQQDESQDSESQKDESQQDSDQPKSDSQESESDQEKSDQPQKQDEQTAADQPQENERKNDEQKADQTGDEQQKNDQQNPSEQQSQPKSSDSKQKQQKPSGEQQQPEDEGIAEGQEAKHEPVPTGDLKAASEQEQDKQPEGAAGTADQNGKEGLMTREEALKMLQSVRDRDMLRRMQQQRQERSRRVRVEKDW